MARKHVPVLAIESVKVNPRINYLQAELFKMQNIPARTSSAVTLPRCPRIIFPGSDNALYQYVNTIMNTGTLLAHD